MTSLTRIAICAITFLFSQNAAFAQDATLTIGITNLRTDRGVVLVNIDTAASWFIANSTPVRSLRLTPHDRTASVQVEGLPAGNYAIRVHHDEDGDGRLDTGLFGIPTERYGFSGRPSSRLGPPPFDLAKMAVDGDSRLTIRLR